MIFICTVEVQLDEPLWVPRVGSKDVAMTIMGYCVLMESVAWNGGQSVSDSITHYCSYIKYVIGSPCQTEQNGESFSSVAPSSQEL